MSEQPTTEQKTKTPRGPRPPAAPRKNYPKAEAIWLIGVGKTKGDQLIASGELESNTIGRNVYVTAEAIDAFLAKKAKG